MPAQPAPPTPETDAAKAPAARRAPRPASWSHIAVYAGGVLALATLGGVVMSASDDPPTSAGALLFVVSPIAMATALRTLGREGWADAGLRLGRSRGWYLFALLLFPVLLAVPLLVGTATGAVRFADDAGGAFAAVVAATLIPRLLFAMFEEWGWRGYLEPRLAALGVLGLRRHLMVGALWAVWHVPYIVAFGDGYTPLPLAVQIPLFTVAVLAMAVIWGVVRERTGSVWPAVLGHGVANVLAFPLIDPDVVGIDHPLVYAARPEGLVILALLVVTAAVVYRRWGAERLEPAIEPR